jgi:diguanylate cyclase (GGDEF)-like protein
LREFSAMDQRGPEDVAFSATFSAGIAAFEPSMDLERWIRAADRALYKAKRKGRNQVAVAGATNTLQGSGLQPGIQPR